MEREILDVMNMFFKKRQKELKQERVKKYLKKDYIQEALKNKYSRVWVVAKLGLELNHYGKIKGDRK